MFIFNVILFKDHIFSKISLLDLNIIFMSTSFEKNFLFVFSQAYPQFRRAEFESICLLFGIQAPNFHPEEVNYKPFLIY